MKEFATKNVPRETYEAFKARERKEFATRHATKPHATRQKLLRVHLRHFMLTIGTTEESGNRKAMTSQQVGELNNSERFVSVQKQSIVHQKTNHAQQHQKARVIQSFARRCRRHVLTQDKSIEGGKELPSSSELILMAKENKSVAPLEVSTKITTISEAVGSDPLSSTTLPPYELLVELVAIRDLMLGSTLFTANDKTCIMTELQLKRQSVMIACSTPTRQVVSTSQESDNEIPLQVCSLRFSMDPLNGIRHGLTSPQSVIEELSARVIVKRYGTTSENLPNTLGVVEIPLFLLETSLATEYAFCRWFPLEKACPGQSARCELRVRVCYRMRQASADNVTMVPYVKVPNPEHESQKRDNLMVRRGKKVPSLTKSKSKSIQKTETEQGQGMSEKLKARVQSPSDVLASRISRAEVLSPPPSPCSVTSPDASKSVNIPRAGPVVEPSRMNGILSKKQRPKSCPVQSLPPKEKQVESTVASSQVCSKTFLKRKPYKVVFEKLDWSSVASKTDSNLSTSTKSCSNSRIASRSTKKLPSKRALKSSVEATNTERALKDTLSPLSSESELSVVIDAATNERITALENAMYKQCAVTRETVLLARYKYEVERKKFVATLQNQAQNQRLSTTKEFAQPRPSQDESEFEKSSTFSKKAIQELWQKLTGDSSGQIYAAMLRNHIEPIVDPTEPDTK